MKEIQHQQCSTAEIDEEQAKDEVWREVISWVEQGRVAEKAETRGKAREVFVACSMFDPEGFKMRDEVLMFTKAANRNRMGEVWWICLPESMVAEVWSLCHQSDVGRHRGLEETLNKFLKGLFMLSVGQKKPFLNCGCETGLTKEQRMPVPRSIVLADIIGCTHGGHGTDGSTLLNSENNSLHKLFKNSFTMSECN